MLLWQWVADESATMCCTSAALDLKKVQSRSKHEGDSFLTITLPNFGKDFEKSLDLGRVDRHHFSGFRKSGELPLFLGGFLDLVFERNTGVLLPSPSIDAILSIRQLTLMFGKIARPCSVRRLRRAMREYVECEHEVREVDERLSPSEMKDFKRMSSMLFADTFQRIDRSIYYLEGLAPKHGPGATADYIRGNAKWNQRSWPHRLENILPAGEVLLPNWSYYDQLEAVDFVEPEAETPVRVVAVPKTLKTPRIIGIEPTAMQYAQQTVLPMIVNGIERSDILSAIIGFEDQVPNQELARKGSLSGAQATLDLSEASDRVSNQLVRVMLEDFPHLHEIVDASRSRKADVPGHGVIRLAKFASMGSGLCFPMEMLVFTTCIFLGIEESLGAPLDRRGIRNICRAGQVRVYGDDIIVPVEHVHSVIGKLELFGASVNAGKSFWTGRFRESCGKEFYAGHDVSIVKVRKDFPASRMDAAGVISLVSLRNQLYWAGYWQTCEKLDSYIRKTIRWFPVVESTSPVLGRESILTCTSTWLDQHQTSPYVKGWTVSSRPPSDPLDGPGALLKCLLLLESRCKSDWNGFPKEADPFEPNGRIVMADHLERSGRPRAVDIKLRNATPY